MFGFRYFLTLFSIFIIYYILLISYFIIFSPNLLIHFFFIHFQNILLPFNSVPNKLKVFLFVCFVFQIRKEIPALKFSNRKIFWDCFDFTDLFRGKFTFGSSYLKRLVADSAHTSTWNPKQIYIFLHYSSYTSFIELISSVY